jgi:hypothetical protein
MPLWKLGHCTGKILKHNRDKVFKALGLVRTWANFPQSADARVYIPGFSQNGNIYYRIFILRFTASEKDACKGVLRHLNS